ncbi:outer membrane protein assembly factor [Candidatus Poribacteria bacterium]
MSCVLSLIYFPYCLVAQVSESLPAQIESSETAQYIRRITFDGNSALNDSKLAELLGIEPGQQFNPQSVSSALPRIVNEYKQLGYLFAKVEWELRPAEKNQVAVYVKIHEGEMVRMGKVELSGNTVFPQERLLEELRILKNSIFDDSVFQADMERLLRLYSDNGHPLAELSPSEFWIENSQLNVKIDIDEGPLVNIHQVQINGLKKTKEEILLRELTVRPGDIFDQREIDESLRRLSNLGYFQTVSMSFEPANADRMPALPDDVDSVILNFSVTEGRTGQFSGVLGYSPSQNEFGAQEFTGVLEATDINLLGTGRQMAIRAKLGLIDNYEFAYEEPWIFDTPVDLGIRLWGINQKAETLGLQTGVGAGIPEQSESPNLREWAASISGTMRMIRAMEGSLAVTYKRIESRAGSADILSAISEPTGNKYSLTITLQRDTRDYFINPSVGRFDSASVEISRGDFKTVRTSLDLNQYFKTWQQQVLAIGLHGTRIWGDRIPLTEMLYLGGANTLRGYSEDFFRGEGRLYTNFEYRFLVSRDSQFFLFLDTGTVYNEGNGLDSLRLGYGVGMRLRSRTGLVSVDYGLARGDSILSGKIHVSLGAAF